VKAFVAVNTAVLGILDMSPLPLLCYLNYEIAYTCN